MRAKEDNGILSKRLIAEHSRSSGSQSANEGIPWEVRK